MRKRRQSLNKGMALLFTIKILCPQCVPLTEPPTHYVCAYVCVRFVWVCGLHNWSGGLINNQQTDETHTVPTHAHTNTRKKI